MTTDEMRAAAATLRAMLGRIEAGELTASASMTYRIEGAVIALEAVVDGRSPTAETFDHRLDYPI